MTALFPLRRSRCGDPDRLEVLEVLEEHLVGLPAIRKLGWQVEVHRLGRSVGF